MVPTDAEVLAFRPNDLPPKLEIDSALQWKHDQAILAIGELRAVLPTLPNAGLVTEPFSRREAVLSSRIEGTRTGLEQLYVFEKQNRSPLADETGDDRDAREVHNYVTALRHGVALLPKLPIGHRLFCEMHERLFDGLGRPGVEPGAFRRQQNFIGRSTHIADATFVPPPPAELAALTSNLERYVNGPRTFPVLVDIAIAHYQFEAIHPFADGNGRIGRILITLMLAETGLLPDPLLYLSAHFEHNRREYYDRLLGISRGGDWLAWVDFFVEGVGIVARDAARRARSLLALREQTRQELQESGQSSRLFTLVDALFATPVTTVNQAMETMGLSSYRGAQKNVERLIQAGFLTEITGQRRNKVYVAKPITDLLDAPSA
ncbi:Adenosine monophosphate-protein transferase SoFic [Pirellulimonas nuda]|uniref:Adenosine monophosphate-protein transferase SoFic n=1 Tax=Pirellulimonas nuda TaxID=2528009 RepID=A0A518D5Z1_9BACT|nr:Fic family protein [Pirellulimonas nuda]QDU86885.1 Adenosine monophosphate-protein transferase SoFic [Pirellulimonas nuda]